MSRTVHTLYCDDIRQEVSGKLSFIGVYQSELIAQSFPITLPKLAVVIIVRSPIDELPKSLTLQIRKNEGDTSDESVEEVLREIVVPEEQLANATDHIESDDRVGRDDRSQRVQSMVVFSPMHLAKPCLIRVYVYADDERLKDPALVVRAAEESSESDA